MKDLNENKNPARRSRRRARTSNRRRILLFTILILLALIGTAVFALNNEFNKKVKTDFKTVDESGKGKSYWKDSDSINVMVLGLEDVRTDMIMVASYNPKRNDLAIISVPRDSHVENDYSDPALHKINSLFAYPKLKGGPERLAAEVSKILGIPINQYVMIDYDGVRNIVDAVGGVEVNIPFKMSYDDPTAKPPLHIHFDKGPTTVMGDQAVEYLRWRKNNYGYRGEEGDIGRVRRQQEFVVKAIQKCLNPSKMLKVVEVAFKNVKTSLKLSDIIDLAKNAAVMDKSNIKTYQTVGRAYLGALWYYENENEVNHRLMEKIIRGETIKEDDLKPSETFIAMVSAKDYSMGGNGGGYTGSGSVPKVHEENPIGEMHGSVNVNQDQQTEEGGLIFGPEAGENPDGKAEAGTQTPLENLNPQNSQEPQTTQTEQNPAITPSETGTENPSGAAQAQPGMQQPQPSQEQSEQPAQPSGDNPIF